MTDAEEQVAERLAISAPTLWENKRPACAPAPGCRSARSAGASIPVVPAPTCGATRTGARRRLRVPTPPRTTGWRREGARQAEQGKAVTIPHAGCPTSHAPGARANSRVAGPFGDQTDDLEGFCFVEAHEHKQYLMVNASPAACLLR